jgi:hypothetical protein
MDLLAKATDQVTLKLQAIDNIHKGVQEDAELIKAFREIQQPRTDFQLEHFVIGNHEVREQQYAHCVLNLRLKYDVLRKTQIHLEKITYEIDELKKKDDKLSEFEWREKEIDREICANAVLGAMREFNTLYEMWGTFEHKYTRAEIDAAQPEYWRKRLTRQANEDLLATGRVGKGNIQSLKQIGLTPLPELDHIRSIEKKFLEVGNTKILVAVATKDKLEELDDLKCLEEIRREISGTIMVKFYNCFGRKPDDAYNNIATELLNDGADILLVVEDDTFPPVGAFTKLFRHIEQGKKAVGGWYRKRQNIVEGTPIIIKNGKRDFLNEPDGEVHEVYTLPMGCTMYNADVFLKLTQPYFTTTSMLTQDSFFSQKLREAGIKMYCDTSIKCKHIDRETGKVYE